MPPVWFSFIAPELLCKSYMITTSLYALHYISGFFLIMSPAEGLHFSALVIIISTIACLQLSVYSPHAVCADGQTISTDVDECEVESLCSSGTYCENTAGSHDCKGRHMIP